MCRWRQRPSSREGILVVGALLQQELHSGDTPPRYPDVDARVPVAVAVNVAAALSGLGALSAVVQYIEKLVVRIHMLTSIPYGMTSQSSFQSIGFMPRLTRNSLVFEKCLHPKKPL